MGVGNNHKKISVTIFIFVANNHIIMGRKGDINTRAIATRIPTALFVKLTMKALQNQQTMSALLGDILAKSEAPSPPLTPQKEKIVYRDKVVYQDRIVYKDGGNVGAELCKELRQKIEQLEAKNGELSDEVLRLQKYDPALEKERRKKAGEKELKMEREAQNKMRANQPYYDKDGKIKFYDKDGNETT